MGEVHEVYRIVEWKNGNPYSLFHGLSNELNGGSRRSRCLGPIGLWWIAERKLVVDGRGQNPYEAGFNVLMTKEKAVEYMGRFTAPRDLRIAKCEARGLRPKPTNPDVFLADVLRIVEVYK